MEGALLVGVATGAMKPLLSKLSNLVEKEYAKVKGVRRELESTRAEMCSMKGALEALEEAEQLDPELIAWRDEVRELSFDMEDSVDDFMARADTKQDGRKGLKGFFDKLKKLKPRHEISGEIKELKARAIEASERHKRYKLNRPTPEPTTCDIDPRLHALYVEVGKLVGIEGPKKHIIDWFKDEGSSTQLRVVSIVGPGGLGKTTLGNAVFQTIKEEFSCKAFVSVSRKPNMKIVLKDIARRVGMDLKDPSNDDVRWLIDSLREHLQDKKYLIVIDDLWSAEAWKTIKDALLNNEHGSRIITTTRNSAVASFCSFEGDYVYRMQPLSSLDSRRLFLGRAFRSEDLCPPHLKEVSERILEKCAGLPLAIITMSSLLADQTAEEVWNKALAAVGSSLAKEDGAGDMTKILSLSYFDLPHYMRACLLYLSSYPEDYIIEKKSLIHKWMAEGFIREVEGQSTYEVGEGYFNDFINRSLIQPAELVGCEHYGEVMACRVHDIILDFITCKAKQENFLTSFSDAEHKGKHKVRRLSVVSCDNERATVSRDLSHVRSLSVCVDGWQNFTLDFPVLRVLHIEGCSSDLDEAFLANIGKFLLLKYLRFDSMTEIIPEGIGKLKYLETLDLRGRGVSIKKLPSTMTQLQRLARLYADFQPACLSDGIFGQLQSLEELEKIKVSETELEKFLQELGQLTKLRTLTVDVKHSTLSEKVDNARFLGTLISSYNLHHLSINYNIAYSAQTFLSQESWRLVNPVALRKICIDHCIIDKVPNWMISLGNLRVLHLSVLYRTRPEDIAILGGMPALLALKLTTWYGRNGKIFIRTGFRRLKFFFLRIIRCGTAVEFEEGSMPKLEHLKLKFKAHKEECVNYAFDFGIQHLCALTKLDLRVDNDNDSVDNDKNDIIHKLIETALGKFRNRPTLSWGVRRHDYVGCLHFETAIKIVWERENEWEEEKSGGLCSFLGLLLEEIKQDALPRMRVMGMLRSLDDLAKSLCATSPPAAAESVAVACALSEIQHEISSTDGPTKAAASHHLSAIARHLLASPAAAAAAPDDLFVDLAQDLLPHLASGSPHAIAEAAHVLAASPSTAFQVLFKPLASCLASPDPLASTAAVAAFCELSAPPADAAPFLPLAPHLCNLLTTSCSIMALSNVLRVLARLLPLDSILVVDPVCQLLARSSDMSLAFQCIRTVLAARPRPAHGVSLAIGKVKEFLSGARDPNLGLLALGILYPGYANECRDVLTLLLNDSFNSNIRREALHLLMEMVDGDNIIGIAGMLVSHAAKLSDQEFANEILGAVLAACARNVYDELVMDLDWYVSLLAEKARSVCCASQLGDEIARQLVDVGLRVLAAGTLSYFEDSQRFESVFRVKRRTFNYICSLVKPVEDITLLDGRVLLLQDQVAIALRMFICGAPVETVLSDVGVRRSTFGLIFWRFVEAMLKQASHHLCWPDSMKMESTKSKFELIHGMPNCCGVVDTTYINTTPSTEPNCDHEKNHSIAVQAVVDPDSRITDIFMGWSDSILQSSDLFEACEKGQTLNGSKLNLSDGSKVGEYIIGDEGHTLLPWFLTPYQEKDLSGPKLEFNRRHSAARTFAQRVLARLKDTWKWMYLGGLGLFSQELLNLSAKITHVSCLLHNIVIDMEGAALEEEHVPSNHDMNYRQQACQLADENAVRMRDILSQHLPNRSPKFGGTLSFLEDEQRFESFFKMKRRTFNYICCLVKSMEDVSSYTFLDGKVMRSEDQVAVALRMLISGGPLVIVASDFSIKESTVSLVTFRFVKAMIKRGSYHVSWPDSIKMEKIKSKFDLIHMLPNCCGVIDTAYISSAEPNRDHEKNYSMSVQVVVDPDMRIIDCDVEWSGTENQSSILRGSLIWEQCEEGEWLNGSKVKLLDGSEVGEYIIGDAGFPLLPWLLTPYQEKDLSDPKVEFNTRLSAVRATTLRGLARLKDTWKCLHRELWRPENPRQFCDIIVVCCMVHNIVIDMEGKAVEEEYVPNGCDVNYSQEVCQLPADANSVRMRDALSHHLASRPSRSAADSGDEEKQVVPSDAGDEEEEQESSGRKAEEEIHSVLAT